MSYSVGQVSGFARVTVRTLHHYDEIGLLRPSSRTRAGHRRYTDADLDRLQQIRFYRELGFSLDDVTSLLDDPKTDPAEHLRRQYTLLTSRIDELRAMATAVERTLEARRMGISLTPQEKFEVFGDFDPDQHTEEVERRWGGSDAYRESRRRTAAYTKEDWQRITAESEALGRRLAELLQSGTDPESEAAMDLAEEHRQQICRHHYDCTYEIHTGLVEMFVADPRYATVFDQHTPGLTAFLRDAALANAIRHL